MSGGRSPYEIGKTLLRRHLRSRRLYAYIRRLVLVNQYLTGRPDDADFGFFRTLDRHGTGLLLDVGANGGQSAIAFAVCSRRSRILSFEPNPELWPELDFVKKLLGSRFDYCRFGLSDWDGDIPLHIPTIRGLPVTTRASVRHDLAQRHSKTLERETNRRSSLEVVRARFRRLDDLDLRPIAVKIDVEGAELAVLKGMLNTLASCRPILMVESNDQSEACRDLVRGLGYRFFEYDVARRTLRALTGRAQNWFGVPANVKIGDRTRNES